MVLFLFLMAIIKGFVGSLRLLYKGTRWLMIVAGVAVIALLSACEAQTSDDIPTSMVAPQLDNPEARGLVNMKAPPPNAESPSTVVRVVDGDTIVIRYPNGTFDDKVRIIGLDTPETKDPRKPVQCWGPEATAHAKALLPEGSKVRVDTDPTQDLSDRYNRAVRHIVMANGQNFATAMVAGGFARAYVYDGRPDIHYSDNVTAQSRAKQGQLGVWGPPCNGHSWGE